MPFLSGEPHRDRDAAGLPEPCYSPRDVHLPHAARLFHYKHKIRGAGRSFFLNQSLLVCRADEKDEGLDGNPKHVFLGS
jgi:hypothetical protein